MRYLYNAVLNQIFVGSLKLIPATNTNNSATKVPSVLVSLCA